LEDINNILNSGEVPNLFEPEEFEKNIIGCRAAAKEAGIAEGNRDAIYDFFINRVRLATLNLTPVLFALVQLYLYWLVNPGWISLLRSYQT
jgi:P-loop containing dynein motor region D4